MGFNRILPWLLPVLMSLFLVTGCGDLEPEMQDTRTVILNMDFNQKSSSRSSSSVSASELSQYNTHLILALPSGEVLTSSYRNYYSSFAQGLMNTADKKVSLEIPLNTQMKIFAFLFKENYSMSELFSGVREVGYYGESQSFSISTNTNSLSLGITLQSTGTDTNTGGGSTDTTPPVIAEVSAVTTPTSDSSPDYTFHTTEAGSITYGGSCYSSTIIAYSGNNTITFNALSDDTYSDCTITVKDSAGNVSNTLKIPTFTVDTTVPGTTAPTVSSIYPADNQRGVSVSDNISVTFSEAMDSTSVTTNTSNSSCSGSFELSSDNFINCVQMSSSPSSSNSNMIFTLDPHDNLTVGTTYKTRVTTGVKDTAGNSMSSQYETSSGFTPADLTAPTVTSVSTTADNQSSVAITDNITLTFSEAMDSTSVTTNTGNTSCSGTLGVSSDNFSSCVQMSSAPASSSDNMTFTLDPSDNLTGSTTYLTRVTTGVKDSAGNTLGSQYVTSSGFTTVSTHYWQLIARQVDSDNFTDGTNELFSSNARSTFLENENDPSQSTFMSIGNLDESNYADTDGKYKFKLVWDGLQVASENIKEVTWTQTSWLDNTTITGFEEIGVSGFSSTDTSVVISGARFTGLGKSGSNQCVIDGNGSTSNWWNCVGAINTHTSNSSTGIPGPLQKIASSMHLYIWSPGNL